MANKISTQSYLIKRLRDSGYNIIRPEITYHVDDNRKWTILLDNAVSSVFITCMKDGSLQLYDGNRFVKNTKLKIDTDSVEVLIEFFNSCGIVNKHKSYKSYNLETNAVLE